MEVYQYQNIFKHGNEAKAYKRPGFLDRS